MKHVKCAFLTLEMEEKDGSDKIQTLIVADLAVLRIVDKGSQDVLQCTAML